MKDYNFFAPFIGGEKKAERTQVSWPIIGIIVVIGLLAWPGFNYFQLYQLNNQIEVMENELLTSPDYPLIAIVDQKILQAGQERQTLNLIQDTSDLIGKQEVIDDQLLFAITTAMPPDTTLFSMSLAGGNLSFNGFAASKPAVAEFEYNLRNTKRFEHLFVPEISIREDGWVFSLVATVERQEDHATD